MSTDARSSLDGRIRFAIAGRRLLQVDYKQRRRVVEPHDYGVQHGVARLFVYQLSASGPPLEGEARVWRLLDLPKIEGCTVLEQTFAGSRGDAHERHHKWDVLYARVE